MNKRKLRYYWKKLRPIGTKYFFLASAVCLIVGVMALRQNNQTALDLRAEVMRVDQENGDVEAALQDLRQHIHSHMNSSLGGGPTGIQQPIQLTERYKRLVEAEKERVSARNEEIYTEAQEICERTYPAGTGAAGRIPCIERYVDEHAIQDQPVPEDLYKFDFVSPAWSPDLAGFSLLFAAVLGLLGLVRFGLERWLRHELSEHA